MGVVALSLSICLVGIFGICLPLSSGSVVTPLLGEDNSLSGPRPIHQGDAAEEAYLLSTGGSISPWYPYPCPVDIPPPPSNLVESWMIRQPRMFKRGDNGISKRLTKFSIRTGFQGLIQIFLYSIFYFKLCPVLDVGDFVMNGAQSGGGGGGIGDAKSFVSKNPSSIMNRVLGGKMRYSG